MEKLERVQYQAALAVTGAWQHSNCSKLNEELRWENLSYRCMCVGAFFKFKKSQVIRHLFILKINYLQIVDPSYFPHAFILYFEDFPSMDFFVCWQIKTSGSITSASAIEGSGQAV